ncbi:MAG: hypothetical protein K2W95_29555 [Candidatus Obscuribacterales bacterium]|nr:hypothetical protein [Candidatus Obscuribacterales bacterium]
MADDRIDHSMMEDSVTPAPNWSETLADAWSKEPMNGSNGEVCTAPQGTGKAPLEPEELEFPPVTQESPVDAENRDRYPGKVPEAVTGLELLLRASKTAAETAYRGVKDSVLPQSLIPLSRGEGILFPEMVPFQKDPPAAREPDVSSLSRGMLKGLADGVAFPIRGLVPFEGLKTDRLPPRGVGPQDNDDRQGKAAHGDKVRAVEENIVPKKLKR